MRCIHHIEISKHDIKNTWYIFKIIILRIRIMQVRHVMHFRKISTIYFTLSTQLCYEISRANIYENNFLKPNGIEVKAFY